MSSRWRISLIVPLVLLVVALLETIALYKVHQHVKDVLPRTPIVVGLTGLGFTIATEWIAPGFAKLLKKLHYESASGAGAIGVWVFYGLMYGVVFYAYYVVEKYGPAYLLPASLR